MTDAAFITRMMQLYAQQIGEVDRIVMNTEDSEYLSKLNYHHSRYTRAIKPETLRKRLDEAAEDLAIKVAKKIACP